MDKRKELKIGIKANVDGFEILKAKVQYLTLLTNELEKTLNFLEDYKFNLDFEYFILAEDEKKKGKENG